MADTMMRFESVAVWRVVDGQWLTPGYYRRCGGGFVPLYGWRYGLHRILWGHQGLVDAR